MRTQSAIRAAVVTVTKTIQVAAGVFAPGHLGELTRHVPFELVDAVVEESRCQEQRLRQLPSRVGVYFLLALGLFSGLGAPIVWGKLVAGLDQQQAKQPTPKALRDLRRRLGEAPVRALFEALSAPVGQPGTPGVRFGHLRTVAFDGCTSIKAPDTKANRGWLGKAKAALGVTGYPAVELMTLVETGTRAILGAVFGPPATGETDYARRLLSLLGKDMLLLIDRGFDAGKFLTEVAGTGAQFLVRLRGNRRLPVLARLDNGDFLTRLDGIVVRIIRADITVVCADGTRYADSYLLATTLLDPRRYPAHSLVALYHERWEHEITYLALRHTLLAGRVLRCKDPTGLRQEIWALLALYQALRMAIVTAIESQPRLDPDRACFTTAVETAKDLLVKAENIVDDLTDPIGKIGRAVLNNLQPTRRPRVYPRKVKSPLSRYNKKEPNRPDHAPTITALIITVHTIPTATQTTKTDLTNGPDP